MALLRATSNSVSLLVNAKERTLAPSRDTHDGGATLLGEVPVRGERTFYAMSGDWLGWLSLAVLPILAGWAVMRRPSRGGLARGDDTGSTWDLTERRSTEAGGRADTARLTLP